MVWAQGGAIILTMVLLAVLCSSRIAHRKSWLSGYWTGKSDLHESLGRMISEHEEELRQHPELLSYRLSEWLMEDHEHDRALAQAQRTTDRRKRRRG